MDSNFVDKILVITKDTEGQGRGPTKQVTIILIIQTNRQKSKNINTRLTPPEAARQMVYKLGRKHLK